MEARSPSILQPALKIRSKRGGSRRGPSANPLSTSKLNMHKGYVSLVLHTHLPFVRHPEEEYFLEENWLFEAITETYIPLIKIFEQLVKDDVDYRVTMSLTPPLASMLRDPLLQQRYIRHLDKLIELSQKEIERTGFTPHYHG